jgi:hypothetical protein
VTTAVPVLPDWLIEAVERLPRGQRGIAFGYAASGWVAGWRAATDAAEAARQTLADGTKPEPAQRAESEDQ